MTKTNITVDQAVQAIRADYYTDIADYVLEARKAMAEAFIKGEAFDLHDWLHDACDGSARLIYTFQARLGLLASDHEDAMEDATGEAGTVEQRMYYAMQADIIDRLPADDKPEGSYLVRDSGGAVYAGETVEAAFEAAQLDDPSSDPVEIGWSPEEDVGAARVAGSAIGWFGGGEIGCELPIMDKETV